MYPPSPGRNPMCRPALCLGAMAARANHRAHLSTGHQMRRSPRPFSSPRTSTAGEPRLHDACAQPKPAVSFRTKQFDPPAATVGAAGRASSLGRNRGTRGNRRPRVPRRTGRQLPSAALRNRRVVPRSHRVAPRNRCQVEAPDAVGPASPQQRLTTVRGRSTSGPSRYDSQAEPGVPQPCSPAHTRTVA